MVRVSDSEDKLNKFSDVRTPGLVTARVDENSKDKEEMALNRKKGMKEFLTERNKGISESPPLPAPPPPLPPPTVSLLPIPNLKKKRKENEIIKKGKVVPQKKPKQQKMAKDKRRTSSMKSKEAKHSTNVRHLTWNPRLELDGAAVPWSSSIKEFQRGHAHYMAEALKRPLLLPKDMDALKHIR